MKRILTTLGILAVAAGLFAGDAAAFVDFGFSADGKTYIFGQYGKTDKDFKGYAEIYTVDIKKNDFVVNGVFKTTDKTGKSGSEVFSQLKNKHKSFLDQYKLCPVEADSLLYVRDEPTKSSSSEIRFKDFESSTPAEDVYFTVKLVPMYEGRGTSTQSSFYIVTEKRTASGALLSRFVVGNPEIKRKGVTGYAIDKIYTSPDGKGFVFVVEKTVEDATGVSIRYMVETIVPPVAAKVSPAPADTTVIVEK